MKMIWLRLVWSSLPPNQFLAAFVISPPGHDERVVDENPPVGFRIEDFMSKHHASLIQDFRDVRRFGLADACGVELGTLRLQPEINDMLRRQCEAHPDILAVFERFVLVTGGGDPVESQLAEQWQQNLFNQLVFRRLVEIGGKKFAARKLVL